MPKPTTEEHDEEAEDVTEETLKARRVKQEEEIQELSSDPESDEESEFVEDDSEGNDSSDEDVVFEDEESDDEPPEEDNEDLLETDDEDAKPKSKLPPLHVLMDDKDVPSAPGRQPTVEEKKELEEESFLVDRAGRRKADQAVKDRVIKLLNTGFHEQSNEHEAKNAMKLAQRLMRKHNLSQALLLRERQEKESSNSEQEILKGGIVWRVKIGEEDYSRRFECR